ncbi:MAG: hypothetical protein OQL09_05655 [Gammaproteobacteria bacterium]|nr:hypothetical protein [Gammaproteobacteria bacterium]
MQIFSFHKSNLSLCRLIIACLLYSASSQAQNTSELNIISSSNSGSNEVNSFIVVPGNSFIPEGIKLNSPQKNISLQAPFVIELKQPPADDENVIWKIVITKKKYGSIELLSSFKGNLKNSLMGYIWLSHELNATVLDRNMLVFRPIPRNHYPKMYKKGRGSNNQRRTYGGGTQHIDNQFFNPRLTYHVFVDVMKAGQLKRRHQTVLQMDNIDMIRQEYINHYNLPRYGHGEKVKLPVPSRDEITRVPNKSPKLIGNPITESKYELLVNDGIYDLAEQVADIYQSQIQHFKQTPLKDMDNNTLSISNNKLWLSGGWRNPERNEWFSSAANGNHQRGGALDIIIYEAPNSKQSAIAYWVLWQGLDMHKDKLDAFWQLETNGRPMRTREFSEDIEPKNGLPDAFDKADHLHININYPDE